MRFHRTKDQETLEKQVLQFTHLGLSHDSHVLAVVIIIYDSICICVCTIKCHLERYQQDQPQTVLDSMQSIYVDNMICREDNVGFTKTCK